MGAFRGHWDERAFQGHWSMGAFRMGMGAFQSHWDKGGIPGPLGHRDHGGYQGQGHSRGMSAFHGNRATARAFGAFRGDGGDPAC
jgi:hypothetical protein